MSYKWYLIVFSLILLFSLMYMSRSLQRRYINDVSDGLERTNRVGSIITDDDLLNLPKAVQNYLRYVGVVGKEKVYNYKVEIDGQMKTDLDKDWANVNVVQFSTLDKFERYFLLKMRMNGIPIVGLHAYKDYQAIMDIRIAGLIKVVDGKGEKMNQAETVTVFNDMCILAPASLIDERIDWQEIDDKTVKAQFTNGDITITATLYFNDLGQLVNFISNDRYFSPDAKIFKEVPWSTPVTEYKNINGYNLASYGEAIWKFPEGDFSYAKFNMKDISYNVS